MYIENLKKKIINTGFKVKIRLKRLKHEKYSVILDYHYFDNGKEHRERKSLGIHITGQKKYYFQEKNKIGEALIIRSNYEKIIWEKKQGIFDEGEVVFIYDWLDRFKNKQIKKNSMKIWKSAIRHFKIFQKKDMLIKDITKKFCEDFALYLKRCNDINQNTAHTYFTRFKIAIKSAYEDDIIPRNYASNIIIKKAAGKREYLTFEEVKKLYKAPYVNERVKRAFIFSCFTGLRLGDLISLRFSDIIIENNHKYIAFFDEKTEEFNKNILHPTAEEIYNIEEEDHNTENVFLLPSESTIRYHIKRMVAKAEINKHITPHCGRHTFATLSINNDIDLYTLSKYLGHNDVKVTQIYAKLIDKKKDKAINKIPVL